MLEYNNDVLFLILEKLQNYKGPLRSCLMVNRTWCETTVPVLWKNPNPTGTTKMIKLIHVIFLHLSEESREILKNQEIDLFTETSQRPLFNYISFWRYLNLRLLEWILDSITSVSLKKSVIRNAISLIEYKVYSYIHKQENSDISELEKLFNT